MDAVAGFSAGCVTTLVMHPLDLIKVRVQADASHHGLGAYSRVFNHLLRHHKVLALYRGLGPNLVGNAVAWGAYFTLYQDLVKRLSRNTDSGPGPATYLVSSLTAGTVTGFVSNPIWVLKTRMLATNRNDPSAYSSMLQGAKQIFYKEGITGFWKGFTPGLMGIVQNAIQFAIYDSLKQHYRDMPRPVAIGEEQDTKGQKHDLDTLQYICFSAVSKVVAALSTYPYQVVRTRMQLQDAVKSSPLKVIAALYRKEGFYALYKGLAANLLRVVPATCTTLLVYEKVRALAN